MRVWISFGRFDRNFVILRRGKSRGAFAPGPVTRAAPKRSYPLCSAVFTKVGSNLLSAAQALGVCTHFLEGRPFVRSPYMLGVLSVPAADTVSMVAVKLCHP